jgi:hypothetical protein
MAKAAAEDELDYTKYLDKEPTDLQARFGDWILDKVGVEFGTKKETDAFREGVRVATALRMPFQRSPENQEASPMVRANRSAASKVQAKKSVRPKQSEEEEGVRPAKAAKKSVRRSAAADEEPAQPARRPARRRAAAASTSTEEAPF